MTFNIESETQARNIMCIYYIFKGNPALKKIINIKYKTKMFIDKMKAQISSNK